MCKMRELTVSIVFGYRCVARTLTPGPCKTTIIHVFGPARDKKLTEPFFVGFLLQKIMIASSFNDEMSLIAVVLLVCLSFGVKNTIAEDRCFLEEYRMHIHIFHCIVYSSLLSCITRATNYSMHLLYSHIDD